MTESEFQFELEVNHARGWIDGFRLGIVAGFSLATLVVLIAEALR